MVFVKLWGVPSCIHFVNFLLWEPQAPPLVFICFRFSVMGPHFLYSLWRFSVMGPPFLYSFCRFSVMGISGVFSCIHFVDFLLWCLPSCTHFVDFCYGSLRRLLRSLWRLLLQGDSRGQNECICKVWGPPGSKTIVFVRFGGLQAPKPLYLSGLGASRHP